MKKTVAIVSIILSVLIISLGIYIGVVSSEAWDGQIHFTNRAVIEPFLNEGETEVQYSDDKYTMAISLNNDKYTLVIAKKKLFSWILKEFRGSSLKNDYVYMDQVGNDIFLFGVLTDKDAQSVLLTRTYEEPIEPVLCQTLQMDLKDDKKSVAFAFKLKPDQITSHSLLSLFNPNGDLISHDIWRNKEYEILSSDEIHIEDLLTNPELDSRFENAKQEIINQLHKEYMELPIETSTITIVCNSMKNYSIYWDSNEKRAIFNTYQETISIGKYRKDMCYTTTTHLSTIIGNKIYETSPQNITYRIQENGKVNILLDLISTN